VTVLSVHPGPIATEIAAEAGFEEGFSPSTVSEGIVSALAAGAFHLFPDEMAKHRSLSEKIFFNKYFF
jgi:hypothetical protein